MTDDERIDEFVEEFLRRGIGMGKACTSEGLLDLMARFGKLTRPVQDAILVRLGRPSGRQKRQDYSRGIRP